MPVTLSDAAIGSVSGQPTASTSSATAAETIHSSKSASSENAGVSTTSKPVSSYRQWARSRKPKPKMVPGSTKDRSEAADKISALAEFKVQYYQSKLELKRQLQEMHLKEHEKRMKLMQMQEELCAAKLRKITEE